jgi:hypothetical protein
MSYFTKNTKHPFRSISKRVEHHIFFISNVTVSLFLFQNNNSIVLAKSLLVVSVFDSTLFLKRIGKFSGNGWYNLFQLVVQRMAEVIRTVGRNQLLISLYLEGEVGTGFIVKLDNLRENRELWKNI